MKFKISENIKRIELHDSNIDFLEINSDSIIITFDWAKLENYNEENLDGLILGKCKLELSGIIKKTFEIITDEETKITEFPKDFQSRLEIIGENESENDNHLRIGSLMNYDEKLAWTNWNLNFNKFNFYWNNHVTFEEWKKGAIAE
ncbi:MAG: hypothetical protein CMC07_02645 [Flavobacteriaceae bacterium]|nr:hypothetical protein [Flavobacteriaceae bacterium]|tara:strand:- start:130 stop:567 length:438 start_codon:yes stop_codon:yes gene_type:complete